MAKIDVVAGGGPEDFVTVRRIMIEGSDEHIGWTLAEVARQVHGEDAGPAPSPDERVERARRRWFAHTYPALARRAAGIGDAFEVSSEDLRWDLAWLGTFESRLGCSAVFYPAAGTKEGHALLARNFDFPTATYREMFGEPRRAGERPLAADPWIVELHPTGGLASLTIGIMDVLGAMDGINEAGLAVTLLADNESSAPEPTGRPQVGLSEQQVVRYLLDTCSTADEARDALLAAKHYYAFVPCHFLVADRGGDAFVWEHSPGHNAEHIVEAAPSLDGRLVCTNHLLHRWPDPGELPLDDASAGTAALTYRRFATLAEEVGGGVVVDRQDIRDQFSLVRFAAPVPGARTFWHAIYDLEEPSVEVSFFLGDEAGADGSSRFTAPLRFALEVQG
jgi:hypothetical protein